MANPESGNPKIVESIQVRRVPQFNQPGGLKKFIYHVTIVTVLGNTGMFEIPAATYEDDAAYTTWLQEVVWQLDKSEAMTQ